MTGYRAEALKPFLDQVVATAHARDDWGKVASYIPELARIDPAQVGIAIALADGTQVSAGACDTPFSIQSVSKVFSLALVLGRIGDDLWQRVGREPSGSAFDSMALLEREAGRPRNPFINAGALVTTDAMITGRPPSVALSEYLGFLRACAGDDQIHMNKAVAVSEKMSGDRNRALVHYLKSHGNLRDTPDCVFGTYAHQCATEMTCVQLARAGRVFAQLPSAPPLLSRKRARRIAALMTTCGHYDGSGEFAFRVGLPGKSGVGGGILVIAPGQASIAVWSPGLDHYGNSKIGTWAAEQIADHTGWSVFAK